MSSAPQAVSALNRYRVMGSPLLSEIDAIELVEHPRTAIRLTWRDESGERQSLDLVVKSEDGVDRVTDIACTDASLPADSLAAAVRRLPRGTSFQHAEVAIREWQRARASVSASATDTATLIAAAIAARRAECAEDHLALDLVTSLLHAASHSARACALTQPFPRACLPLQPTDTLDGYVTPKTIDAALPALEAAFAWLPPVAQWADDIHSLRVLPPDVIALVYSAVRSPLKLRCVPVRRDLYTLGTTEAHRDAALRQKLDSRSQCQSQSLPDYQFDVLEPNDPVFDRAATMHGTVIGFHGSPVAHWHSIVHRGLEAKSGTKEQQSGAIFGPGIYFSDDLRVSRMFSAVGRSWPCSQLGQRIEVVGLYAIVDSPEGVRTQRARANRDDPPENYLVVRDNSFLQLRSLLVWRAPEASNRASARGHWLLLVYACLLLVVMAAGIDWRHWHKLASRQMRAVLHYNV